MTDSVDIISEKKLRGSQAKGAVFDRQSSEQSETMASVDDGRRGRGGKKRRRYKKSI